MTNDTRDSLLARLTDDLDELLHHAPTTVDEILRTRGYTRDLWWEREEGRGRVHPAFEDTLDAFRRGGAL